MTTDITELAQSLKAAAPNVTSGPWVVKDYFWLTPESEVFSGEFVECHNGPDAQYLKLLSPENILTLVEALELKEEQRANWFQMAQKLGEDLDAAEKRIAELESRTVKLPAAWWVKQGSQSLLAYEKQMLLDALSEDGIKWEAE